MLTIRSQMLQYLLKKPVTESDTSGRTIVYINLSVYIRPLTFGKFQLILCKHQENKIKQFSKYQKNKRHFPKILQS